MTLSTWSLRGSSTLSYASNQTTTNITKPATAAIGDIAIVTQYQETDTYKTVTPPTGFIILTRGENATPTPDIQYTSWYKVLDGSEGATLNFSHAQVEYRGAICTVYTPPVQPAALDVQSAAVQIGNATTLALTAITTTHINDLVIACQVNYSEENVSAITSPFVVDTQLVGGLGGGISCASNEQAAAASTGTITITFPTSIGSVGAMHAFEPADAAAAKARALYQRKSIWWPSRRR